MNAENFGKSLMYNKMLIYIFFSSFYNYNFKFVIGLNYFFKYKNIYIRKKSYSNFYYIIFIINYNMYVILKSNYEL